MTFQQEKHIEIIENDDGWITVTHIPPGVASQGKTLPEALVKLADAIKTTEETLKQDDEVAVPDVPWFDE